MEIIKIIMVILFSILCIKLLKSFWSFYAVDEFTRMKNEAKKTFDEFNKKP